MNNQKGFINIILIIIVVALVSVGAYFVSTRQITPPTPTPTPAFSSTTPKETAVNKNIKQGIFGTVSTHEYGCGQPPPDGSGCGKDVNKVVGEGEKITVSVVDKIDSYGNADARHIIATYYTDQKGTYRAYLNPGKYIVCPTRGSGGCEKIISVESGKFMEVNLSIDFPRP